MEYLTSFNKRFFVTGIHF